MHLYGMIQLLYGIYIHYKLKKSY